MTRFNPRKRLLTATSLLAMLGQDGPARAFAERWLSRLPRWSRTRAERGRGGALHPHPELAQIPRAVAKLRDERVQLTLASRDSRFRRYASQMQEVNDRLLLGGTASRVKAAKLIEAAS